MNNVKIYSSMPTVALRGMVMFPNMNLHFEVGRKKSIAAIRAAVSSDQKIFLVAQQDASVEDPKQEDLFAVGVVAEIKQVVRLTDSGNIRVVVEGIGRGSIARVLEDEKYFICDINDLSSAEFTDKEPSYTKALIRKTRDIFEKYISYSSKIAKDVANEVFFGKDPGYLADFIASNAFTDYEEKQIILETLDPFERLESVCLMLDHEANILMLEDAIEQRVQEQMDKNQQDYYLREKLKAIYAELGEGDDIVSEADGYKEKIYAAALSDDAEKKLLKECDKLSKMQSNSVDANVIRTYLDECLRLPWNKYTSDNFDLTRARKVLDNAHYGMDKVKKRFIEMLAVRALAPDIKGQIICLVGPPGVGKTSIVQSIAKAMGRKYVRMSLGGVRDEAEIRGHRKTYVGAMPGRIASALQQAGSFNPIILLDEIDKLGSDYKGDPSSALLEALDPEQNSTFRDHYIELPIDLSKVIFITTANDASTIPAALYDRMEVFELSSYTLEEKVIIAKDHLVKKQRKMHGLNARNFKISESSLRFLIDGYTREAGVRRLEQLIAALCRKTAVMIGDGEAKSVNMTNALIKDLLGPVKFKIEAADKDDLIGVVNGLAWTKVGGEMLQVEALVMDGSGKLELTGSLGDVMKESAKAALSYIRSVADDYAIDKDVFKNKDIHIHVPQGAVPKDGPSAGVTIATALLSAFTARPVRHDIAMTGEISLTGRVMAIGGLREKSMAAFKAGIKRVIIPCENESDLWEIDSAVKENVEFITASKLRDVFEAALISDKVTVSAKARTNIKLGEKKKSSNVVAQ